jgi:streptogramin lyase
MGPLAEGQKGSLGAGVTACGAAPPRSADADAEGSSASPFPGARVRARGRRPVRVGHGVRRGGGSSSRSLESRRRARGGRRFSGGIAVASGSVWFVDRERGRVGRLDARTLEPVGKPIGRSAAHPRRSRAPGRYLFVGDSERGTVTRIDVRSGKSVGRTDPSRSGSPRRARPRSRIGRQLRLGRQLCLEHGSRTVSTSATTSARRPRGGRR